MESKAFGFVGETICHHARHRITRIAATAVFLAQNHLDAGGARPTVDVDEEDHANELGGGVLVDGLILMLLGNGEHRPCDGAARFRVTDAGFPGLDAVDPRL